MATSPLSSLGHCFSPANPATIFFGRNMKVDCPQCSTSYDFEDTLISSRGTRVKCTECNFLFRIKRDDVSDKGWFLRLADGSVHHIYSMSDLQHQISIGVASPDAELSKDESHWKRLHEIPELLPLFDKLGSAMNSLIPPGDTGPAERPSQAKGKDVSGTQVGYSVQKPGAERKKRKDATKPLLLRDSREPSVQRPEPLGITQFARSIGSNLVVQLAFGATALILGLGYGFYRWGGQQAASNEDKPAKLAESDLPTEPTTPEVVEPEAGDDVEGVEHEALDDVGFVAHIRSADSEIVAAVAQDLSQKDESPGFFRRGFAIWRDIASAFLAERLIGQPANTDALARAEFAVEQGAGKWTSIIQAYVALLRDNDDSFAKSVFARGRSKVPEEYHEELELLWSAATLPPAKLSRTRFEKYLERRPGDFLGHAHYVLVVAAKESPERGMLTLGKDEVLSESALALQLRAHLAGRGGRDQRDAFDELDGAERISPRPNAASRSDSPTRAGNGDAEDDDVAFDDDGLPLAGKGLDWYLKQGDTVAASGNRLKARTLYQAALEQEPGNGKVVIKIAKLELRLGSAAEAMRWFRRAMSSRPADAYVGIGDCYRKMGKRPQAEAAYQKALEINPRHSATSRIEAYRTPDE